MTENNLSSAIDTTRLDYAASDNRSKAEYFGVSTETWGRVLVIAALFAAVFWPNLRRLWLKTNPFTGEANWSHSIFVPLIGLYYLFINREELIKAGATDFIWGRFLRPGRAVVAAVMAAVGAGMYFVAESRSGLVFSMISAIGSAVGALGVLVFLLDWSLGIILFGIAVYVYGIYPGQNDYLKDLGMVITLFGVVLMLNGWKAMKIAWFPVAFLVCAIPWPGLVYSWVAEPLSHMAAHFAVDVLKLTGVDGQWAGSKIIIFGQPGQPPRVLNVEEACAGMKSLMTFIAVSGAVAFLPPRPLWQRIIIVVSAVPIAIFCNMMRISVTGLLDHYVSTKWSDSFAHQFVGIIMLLPAFFLILMVAGILERVFITEADDNEAVALRTGAFQVAAIQPRSAAAPVVNRPVTAPMATPTATAGPRAAAAGPVKALRAVIPQTVPAAVIPPRPPVAPVPPGRVPTGPIPTGPIPTGPIPPAPRMTPPRPGTAPTPRSPVAGGGVPPVARPAAVPPGGIPPRPVGAPRPPVTPPPYKPVDPASARSAGNQAGSSPGNPTGPAKEKP